MSYVGESRICWQNLQHPPEKALGVDGELKGVRKPWHRVRGDGWFLGSILDADTPLPSRSDGGEKIGDDKREDKQSADGSILSLPSRGAQRRPRLVERLGRHGCGRRRSRRCSRQCLRRIEGFDDVLLNPETRFN